MLAPGARDALVALTSGEHAAVFAYGVVAARVSPGRRRRQRGPRGPGTWPGGTCSRSACWRPASSRRSPRPPTSGAAPDASGAARLAATVERRLAGLAVRAVAATEGDDRREAATGLVEGARRLAGWTGRPETLPG